MDNNINLAPHEIMGLIELIDSNLIAAKKIQSSISMIKDEDLKSFMEKSLSNKKDNIDLINTFIENNMNMQ
jgi:hypothetical protein